MLNSMASQYNLRSPAVKRLMREAEELREPTEEYYAQPLDENLFEWHFTVKGPVDSDFANGYYHGRIILPNEYPMKPPSIILLTPSGRFETNKKICLSISGHHPESWQPSWSIRTALLAIIGFMPTEGLGAIGSLDFSSEERKDLAIKSQSWPCPTCGVISDLLKPSTSPVSEQEVETNKQQKELAKQICFKGSQVKEDGDSKAGAAAQQAQAEEAGGSEATSVLNSPTSVPEPRLRRSVAQPDTQHSSNPRPQEQQNVTENVNLESSGPWLSTYVIILLIVALAFLAFRRMFLMS